MKVVNAFTVLDAFFFRIVGALWCCILLNQLAKWVRVISNNLVLTCIENYSIKYLWIYTRTPNKNSSLEQSQIFLSLTYSLLFWGEIKSVSIFGELPRVYILNQNVPGVKRKRL